MNDRLLPLEACPTIPRPLTAVTEIRRLLVLFLLFLLFALLRHAQPSCSVLGLLQQNDCQQRPWHGRQTGELIAKHIAAAGNGGEVTTILSSPLSAAAGAGAGLDPAPDFI